MGSSGTPRSLYRSSGGRARANAAARRRAAAGEPIVGGSGVRGSGLVADPDHRITLSDPRVEKQHRESQAKLEALLAKLDALHGEDAAAPGLNTQQVPLTQEDLGQLKSAVKAAIDLLNAPSLSSQLIEALTNIHNFLQDCLKKMAGLGIAAAGAFQSLEWAVEALKELLVALGVSV